MYFWDPAGARPKTSLIEEDTFIIRKTWKRVLQTLPKEVDDSLDVVIKTYADQCFETKQTSEYKSKDRHDTKSA